MRTTVEIDEKVLEALRDQTGLRTKKDTVDCALRFLLDHLQHDDMVVLPTLAEAGRVVSLCPEKARALRQAVELPQSGVGASRISQFG